MMAVRVILILVLGLGALVGSHIFIWHSATAFLRIADPRTRAWLLVSMIALSVSFPATLLLSRAVGGAVVRMAYLGAAFWIGLAIHLVMALALAWAAHGAMKAAGKTPDTRLLLASAVVLSLAASAIGLWRAVHPQIIRVDAEIKDLPAQWQGKTVVHLSDLHLGMLNGRWFLEDVCEQAQELDPDLVLITGDLFDGSCPDPQSFKDLLRAIPAKEGVFFVTGNHEGYLGVENALAALEGTGIRILDDEIAEVKGLQIIGASFPEHGRKSRGDSQRGLASYDPGKPSILLYHTPTNLEATHPGLGTQQVKTYFSPDTDFRFAQEKGIDLQLSGHAHAGQIFPFGAVTGIIYGGFHRGFHRLGSFSINVSCGTGTWGPPVRTAGTSEITAITLCGKTTDKQPQD